MRIPFCIQLVAAGLLLGACSSDVNVPIPGLPEAPQPPGEVDVRTNAKKAAAEAKLNGPIEISEIRRVERGPGEFYVCVRAINDRRNTFTVAYVKNAYSYIRRSVIMEECGSQQYSPL
jgi:hypothetical protein